MFHIMYICTFYFWYGPISQGDLLVILNYKDVVDRIATPSPQLFWEPKIVQDKEANVLSNVP